MTLLMLDISDSVQTWSVDSIEDAKYQVQRRVEKEGYEAVSAWLVDSTNVLPAKQWVDEYYSKRAKAEKETLELQEKAEYERLKKKFERNSKK